MKHARKSSGPFCMVRFLRTDGALGTFTPARSTGDAVVFPAGAAVSKARVAVVPTWRVGRGRLTLYRVARS